MALTCSLILIVTTMAVSLYLQKVGLPHPDDVRQHAKKKDNLNSNHEDYKAKANSGT